MYLRALDLSPELLRVTNLCVNFKLHTLGDRPQGTSRDTPSTTTPSELVVQGSCLCHGHAAECRPAPRVPQNVEGMVSTVGGASCGWWEGKLGDRGRLVLPSSLPGAWPLCLLPPQSWYPLSAARTCTRTTHGRQQSLGTPMPTRPAHSIATFLVLLQNVSVMGMPAVVTLTWPCISHLAT